MQIQEDVFRLKGAVEELQMKYKNIKYVIIQEVNDALKQILEEASEKFLKDLEFHLNERSSLSKATLTNEKAVQSEEVLKNAETNTHASSNQDISTPPLIEFVKPILVKPTELRPVPIINVKRILPKKFKLPESQKCKSTSNTENIHRCNGEQVPQKKEKGNINPTVEKIPQVIFPESPEPVLQNILPANSETNCSLGLRPNQSTVNSSMSETTVIYSIPGFDPPQNRAENSVCTIVAESKVERDSIHKDKEVIISEIQESPIESVQILFLHGPNETENRYFSDDCNRSPSDFCYVLDDTNVIEVEVEIETNETNSVNGNSVTVQELGNSKELACDNTIPSLQKRNPESLSLPPPSEVSHQLVNLQTDNTEIECNVSAESSQDEQEHEDIYEAVLEPISKVSNRKCDGIFSPVYEGRRLLDDNSLDRLEEETEQTLQAEADVQKRIETLSQLEPQTLKTVQTVVKEDEIGVQLNSNTNDFSEKEKTFTCQFCIHKKFLRERSLQLHMRIHPGIKYSRKKAQICAICEKAFVWPSELKTHIRTHTGEKPFICQICSRGFANFRNLKRHAAACSRPPKPPKPYVKNTKAKLLLEKQKSNQ